MKTITPQDFLIVVTSLGRSRFSIRLDSEDLGTSSEPLYAASRILMSRGHDPEKVVAMRHAGSEIIAMRGRIGRLAGWSISDGSRTSPARVKYRPFDGAPHHDPQDVDCRHTGQPLAAVPTPA